MNRRQILKSIFVAPLAAFLGTKASAFEGVTACRRCGIAFAGTPGTDQYLCDLCVAHLKYLTDVASNNPAISTSDLLEWNRRLMQREFDRADRRGPVKAQYTRYLK